MRMTVMGPHDSKQPSQKRRTSDETRQSSEMIVNYLLFTNLSIFISSTWGIKLISNTEMNLIYYN
jgi:hypothetical protein